MKKILFTVIFLFFVLASCDKNDDSTKEGEAEKLSEMLDEIVSLSESANCVDPADWNFTAIGNKACGGPTGYIAYSNEIDVDKFLEQVEKYSLAQKEFNVKWEISSDCSLPAEPLGIVCENGKPKFEY